MTKLILQAEVFTASFTTMEDSSDSQVGLPHYIICCVLILIILIAFYFCYKAIKHD
jgi:hypothetical protein